MFKLNGHKITAIPIIYSWINSNSDGLYRILKKYYNNNYVQMLN